MSAILGLFRGAAPWWLLPASMCVAIFAGVLWLANSHLGKLREDAAAATELATSLAHDRDRLAAERDELVAIVERAQASAEKAAQLAGQEQEQAETLKAQLDRIRTGASIRPAMRPSSQADAHPAHTALEARHRNSIAMADCVLSAIAAGTPAADCEGANGSNSARRADRLPAASNRNSDEIN